MRNFNIQMDIKSKKILQLERKNKELRKKNRYLSSQLIEMNELKASQEHFIDGIEHVINAAGFEMVEIKR